MKGNTEAARYGSKDDSTYTYVLYLKMDIRKRQKKTSLLVYPQEIIKTSGKIHRVIGDFHNFFLSCKLPKQTSINYGNYPAVIQ